MWPAPSTEERRTDAPARDGAADSRQATTDSPREGMPGPSTGYRPRRHCWGRAEPRRRRVWLRSHARSARVEPSRSQANYRSCSLELGRRRLSSPTSPPQPVASRREPERTCAVVGRWSLGDKVHRGGVHRPFAHAFSQSAGTQVANAKAVCGATSRMQTKMRIRIRTLLETASCLSKTGSPILPAIWSSCIGFLVFQGPKQAARTGVFP